MNKIFLGAVGGLLLAGLGTFWLQARAAVEEGAPPPVAPTAAAAPLVLPTASPTPGKGPALPEATELSREQKRFLRYDRDHDWSISRVEMLSTRTDGFRKLDRNGDNLLSFEEWAVTTASRFDKADRDEDRSLSLDEFRAGYKRPKAKARCAC